MWPWDGDILSMKTIDTLVYTFSGNYNGCNNPTG